STSKAPAATPGHNCPAWSNTRLAVPPIRPPRPCPQRLPRPSRSLFVEPRDRLGLLPHHSRTRPQQACFLLEAGPFGVREQRGTSAGAAFAKAARCRRAAPSPPRAAARGQRERGSRRRRQAVAPQCRCATTKCP